MRQSAMKIHKATRFSLQLAFLSASSSLSACNKGCGISGFNPHFKGITNVKSQKNKNNTHSRTQTDLDWQSSKTLDVNAVRENYLNWFILKVPRAFATKTPLPAAESSVLTTICPVLIKRDRVLINASVNYFSLHPLETSTW
jgi:hypothetical protein